MARFLFTVWPYVGHVHNSITVARELQRRGHEIGFYSGPRIGPLVEAERFCFFPFRALSQERVDHLVLGADGITAQQLNVFKLKALWKEFLLGTVPSQLADLGPILDRWQPDEIVCDPAMWGPILVLHEARRLPVPVLLYVTACLLPGRDAPLLGATFPRPTRWPTRLRAGLIRLIMGGVALEFRHCANQIRRTFGLPPLVVSVNEYTGQMPLYLLPSLPQLDYNRTDLPPSVHYLGPLPWTDRRQTTAPSWLDELPPDRPLIYVTEGTAQPQEPLLLKAALPALANLPVQVVLTTGPLRKPTDLGFSAIPSNVRIEQWVSHAHLLPRISLLVTAGGTGTLMASLKEGVPVIVVPLHWEQAETAWRIAEAGVGVALLPRQCTPERLRAAVWHVLREPSFRHNAQRMGELLRRAPGPSGAADLLEGLVVGRSGGGDDPRLSAEP